MESAGKQQDVHCDLVVGGPLVFVGRQFRKLVASAIGALRVRLIGREM